MRTQFLAILFGAVLILQNAVNSSATENEFDPLFHRSELVANAVKFCKKNMPQGYFENFMNHQDDPELMCYLKCFYEEVGVINEYREMDLSKYLTLNHVFTEDLETEEKCLREVGAILTCQDFQKAYYCFGAEFETVVIKTAANV